MPPADSEHGLRVQLATALRERDEWNREAGLLRDALITWQRNAEKTTAERDALRAENGRLRNVINGMHKTYCFHTCPVDAPHEATCMDAAALASPGDGEEGKS